VAAEQATMPKPPEIGTAIGTLLSRAGLDRAAGEPRPMTLPPPGPARPSLVPEPPPAVPQPPRPRAELSAGEFAALNQAYRGVQPIRKPKRARTLAAPRAPATPRRADPADEAARERLAALVAGGQRFHIERDDDWVQGVRADVSPQRLRRLASARFEPEATLDLHGLRREEAGRKVAEFVRTQHRRGARYLLIIVGKGTHSEGGTGVLGSALVDELVGGIAAPLVAAFTSAHPQRGGRGAIAVQLA
jgi:DNA-nicking Smr family endonuclease